MWSGSILIAPFGGAFALAFGRQREGERRPFVLIRLEPDPSAMELHEFFRNEQAEADPADVLLHDVASAEEGHEHPALLGVRDAAAVVLDGHLHELPVATSRTRGPGFRDRDLDVPVLRGVLHRVRDEVLDDL